MHKKTRFTKFSLFVSIVAALGGLLFGYNTSVISGALLFLMRDFALTTFQQELVVSTLLIGALVGALAGGVIADFFGRKKALFFTLILFFLGTLCLERAHGLDTLLLGRFITGLAIGIASLAVPLYIAEMSPRESRGALVSLNQLLITIGILLAYLISYAYAPSGAWRGMFAFGLIPILFQCVGLFFIPETPSWLISHHRREMAEKVLHKIRIASPQQPLVTMGREEDTPTQKGWKELLNPTIRKPLLVGIGISVFQQITGINTVIYYAPQIFERAGYETAETAIFATLLVGCVNVLLTIIALWLIDRIGRKPLLIGGLLGMALSLALLGLSFWGHSAHTGLTAIAGLMVYVAFFAVSLGPVAWLIISEVYPLGIRGRAMGIATFANWSCNYLVSLTFLTLLQVLGTSATFWLYTFICLIALWFVLRFVPETKGKTFEEIQGFWKK